MDNLSAASSDLLTPREAARRLGLAVNTLAKLRLRGSGPEYIKLGSAVRYPADALETYIAAQPRRRSTQEPSSPST